MCDPAENPGTVMVATPFVTVPVPITVVPSVNVTVPVVYVGNVAVNVTDCVVVEGFADDVSVIEGLSFVTVCVVVPVAGLLFPSPL